MSRSQIGYPYVSRSITNPNTNETDVLDRGSPFPFLQFIKLIRVTFEPDTIQDYYNWYLKEWNKASTLSSGEKNDIIVQIYRDFIRDLSINYTTLEEREYLSKLNYDDPIDLELATNIFTRKIKEIVDYYNDQRELIKNGIIERKIRGTNFGLQRAILENVINYINNIQESLIYYDVDTIRDNYFVDIRELYTNDYSFNLTPDENLYDAKSFDWGIDMFLKDNDTLVSQLCADITDEMRQLKELDDLFDNVRSSTKKYIGTEFFYLSTNSSKDYVVDKLFTKDANEGDDFQNVYFPSNVASTPETFKTMETMGFFRPSNTTIYFVDGKTNSYSVDIDNLEADKVYYFPNPTITGNANPIMTFFFNLDFVKKNGSSGIANNEPILSPQDIPFHSYTSKISPESKKFVDDLVNQGAVKDSKYDVFGNMFALISNSDDFKRTFTDFDGSVIKSLIMDGYDFYDTPFREYDAFDYNTQDDSGTSLSGTYDELLRSGITTQTNDFSPLTGDFYTLSFLRFTDDNSFIKPTDPILITETIILDGTGIKSTGDEFLIEEISSDDVPDTIATPEELNQLATGAVYYDVVIEAGVFADQSPVGDYDAYYVRPIPDLNMGPQLIVDARFMGEGSNVHEFDGGFLSVTDIEISAETTSLSDTSDTVFQEDINPIIEFEQDYLYIPESSATTLYEVPSATGADELFIRKDVEGTLFTKSVVDGKVYAFTELFPNYITRYPTNVVNFSYGNNTDELTGVTEIEKDNGDIVRSPSAEVNGHVVEFETFADVIMIKTANYLIIDKIEYTGTEYVLRGAAPVIIREYTGNFDKLSNRYRLGGDIFYATLSANYDLVDTREFEAVPVIFKYNIESNKNDLIYPLSNSSTEGFELLNSSTKPVKLNDLHINFSSRTDRFSLVAVFGDLNNMPNIHDYKFTLYPDVNFVKYEAFSNPQNTSVLNLLGTEPELVDLSNTSTSTSGNILII